MMDDHLTAEDLERILSLDQEACALLLLHHLAVCSGCSSVGGYILDLYREGAIGLDLDWMEIQLARSRKEASQLLEHLRTVPVDEQKAQLREDKRFRSWGLCELLCRESGRAAAAGDPAGAVAHAELAVGLAGTLEEWQPAERAWLEELRAYALAHLGHARRAAGDGSGAEAAFQSALALWKPANEDVGDILDYEADFRALVRPLSGSDAV